jgi:ADP-heptose:LPS heptosyltransferase
MTHVRYALVMTEDWCGDGVLNLPIISKIVQAMPHAELKIVYRTGHDDLNGQYMARGITHLPVVTFFDDDASELATWEEHPAIGTTLFEEWKASQPEFMSIRYATDIDEAEREQKLKPFYRQLLQEMFTWYDGERNLQKATVDEIYALLA